MSDEPEVKRGPGRPPKPTTKPVRFLRGYWPHVADDAAPFKAHAGQVLDLPIDEARAVVAAGIAERADDF